jgi:hypothetical protein
MKTKITYPHENRCTHKQPVDSKGIYFNTQAKIRKRIPRYILACWGLLAWKGRSDKGGLREEGECGEEE